MLRNLITNLLLNQPRLKAIFPAYLVFLTLNKQRHTA